MVIYRRIFFIICLFFFLLFLGGSYTLFFTDFGHNIRRTVAATILSSQHRQLAKYTFLSQDELDDILNTIQNPKYINSYSKDSANIVLQNLKKKLEEEQVQQTTTTKAQQLLAQLRDLKKQQEETAKQQEKQNNSTASTQSQNNNNNNNNNSNNNNSNNNTSEPSNSDPNNNYQTTPDLNLMEGQSKVSLIVSVKTVQAKFSDHYYKGKLMTISNPSNVHLVSSKGTQGRGFGEQLPIMARRSNAIGAVNASGFLDPNGNGNGGTPIGIVIENGKITNTPGGSFAKTYVGGLTKDGVFLTGFYSADELISYGVNYAAGFKPQLIVNGKPMYDSKNGGWGYGPRTAIAQKQDGSIMFLVIDGRQSHSIGASIKDIQDLLLNEGAYNAMAMDGGSSSLMYFEGKTVTIPSSLSHIPRYLPNSWVVTPGIGQHVEIYDEGKLFKTMN